MRTSVTSSPLPGFCSLCFLLFQTILNKRSGGVTPAAPENERRMKGPSKSQEPDYQRVVLKDSPYHYLRVSLELEDASTKLSAVELKQFIITGLRSLFGEVGAALDFDVLTYSEDTLTAVLRVPSRGVVKLWSSLTLLGSYQDQACAFRVLQASPFLLSLTANSRELQLG